MIDKPFDDIEFGDLERLVENAVAESRTMEYKRELPGVKDAAKKEFLADVSAFANTVGGDLLYGVTEEDGVAAAIDGVKIANLDDAILKYENMIKTGIEPKIFVQMKGIETPEKKTVLLVRVEKSWFAPHRVVYKGHDKFYARNSSGKYSLDTQQLRDAFNLSQTVGERMREFRTGRIFEISTGNAPVELVAGAKAVLHFLPLSAFSLGNVIEVQKIIKDHDTNQLQRHVDDELPTTFLSPTPNFEGVVHRDVKSQFDANKMSWFYIQMFRNGSVESVMSISSGGEGKSILNQKFVRTLIRFLAICLNFAKKFDISPPAFVCLTLVGAKDYQIFVPPALPDDPFPKSPEGKIDRDILPIPEKMIDSYDVDPRDVLSPMFDIVWQACGAPEMPDSEKKW